MINWILRSYQSYKEKLHCFYKNCILCTNIIIIVIIINIIINIVTITGKNSYEEEKQWKENQWY